MGNFVHLWQFYGLNIHISTDIEPLLTQNMKFRHTFYIKLVSFKHIDIRPIFGAYVHIWAIVFGPQLNHCCPILMEIHIRVQETNSYKYIILNLGLCISR